MTILVTGGAGFIGSNFIRHALAHSDEPIVNLDLLTYAGLEQNLNAVQDLDTYDFVNGDIRDSGLCASLLERFKPRAIVNFAAESHVDRSISGPEMFVQTNVMGVCKLLEAATEYWRGLGSADKRDFKFLQVSTDEVFGSLDHNAPPFNERNQYQPNSPYSASKAAADHFVRSFHQTFGLPTITTNCSNNYGPFQFPEKFIPMIIKNAVDAKPIPLYGDGKQIRDWLHVVDHCKAIQLALERGKAGESYNVGARNEVSNIEVVERVCQHLDSHLGNREGTSCFDLVRSVEDRPGHDRRYAVDPARAELELGWSPEHSFESGLESTVNWYMANLDWLEFVAARALKY